MLRSVDLKQVIVQSNSMERVQQTQQQHPEMQQRYLDIQLGAEKKLEKESIHLSEESEEARLRKKDAREDRGRKDGDAEQGKKPETAGGEGEPDETEGGRIDIRV